MPEDCGFCFHTIILRIIISIQLSFLSSPTYVVLKFTRNWHLHCAGIQYLKKIGAITQICVDIKKGKKLQKFNIMW